MKIDPLLVELVQACSVPGNERRLRDFLIGKLESYGVVTTTAWTDFYVTLAADERVKKTNSKKTNSKIDGRSSASEKPLDIVITAHMDAPGFIVRDLHDNGCIDIISLGGIAAEHMHGRAVRLVGSKQSHRGILHVVGEADGKMTAYSGFFGFSSRAQAVRAGIQKGDSVCFDADVIPMAGGYVAAPHIDNRIGLFMMVKLAALLAKKKLACNVHFAATSCEEVNGRGAKTVAEMIQPDLAICLDATYEEGSVKMSKGPAMTLSDQSVLIPMHVRDRCLDIAKREKIPFQLEVYNYAGTDAGHFGAVSGGCLTLSPLIATLNNHMPCEIFNLKDVDATIRFVAAVVKDHRQLLAP